MRLNILLLSLFLYNAVKIKRIDDLIGLESDDSPNDSEIDYTKYSINQSFINNTLIINLSTSELPYYIQEKDISISYNSEVFKVNILKGYISAYSPTIEDINFLIYPCKQINNRIKLEYNYTIKPIDSPNSNLKYEIIITIASKFLIDPAEEDRKNRKKQRYAYSNLINVVVRN